MSSVSFEIAGVEQELGVEATLVCLVTTPSPARLSSLDHHPQRSRVRRTGDSLCYAFIGFDTDKASEDAYFKMNNVLIDDRRIKARSGFRA